jgi:hypothetical protein
LVLKKAFYRQSLACHPDKRPQEDREDATLEMQRVNAAYQRACLGAEPSDDEEDYGFDATDDIFDFFAHV